MKMKKVLALVLCAILLVAGSVLGTLAYLQDSTKVVKNTFTAGNVDIDLDEADVNEYGQYIDEDGNVVDEEVLDRVYANEYKLIPGHTYIKDPTVHVTAGSEVSWLFVKVVNGLEDIIAAPTIKDQMDANGWVLLDAVNGIWYYNATVDARAEAVDKIVFGSFTLTDDAAVTEYTSAQITIQAYAVQADTFDTAAEAWEATFGA